MNEQNNKAINSQTQVELNENKSKKKRNGLFTIFACIMTAIIVVLAMNIGQQLYKNLDKKNINFSNSNSSEISNNNSNVTTNCNTNQSQDKVYTNKDIMGVYTYNTNDLQYTVELYSNGLFSFAVNPKGSACGAIIRGNYYIDGNSIMFNSLVYHSCDGQGEKSISVTSAKISDGNIILSKNILTSGNTKELTNVTFTKSEEKVEEEKTEDFLNIVYSVIVQGVEANKQQN